MQAFPVVLSNEQQLLEKLVAGVRAGEADSLELLAGLQHGTELLVGHGAALELQLRQVDAESDRFGSSFSKSTHCEVELLEGRSAKSNPRSKTCVVLQIQATAQSERG